MDNTAGQRPRIKAGRWLRVSTGRQDEGSQLPDIDAWCADHDYEVTKTYQLHGKSAFKGKQDSMIDEVIADMASGEIDVLVVWASDRIERRGAYNAFDLARRVREVGGRIEYVKDAYLNDANEMSDVMLALAATRDKQESKRKSDRTLAKQNALRLAGSFVGRPPFGYKITAANGIKLLAVDPGKAAYVREAVERYLSGESLRDIKTWLDAEGIRTSSGKLWTPASLSEVLRNETLIGRRKNGKGQVTDKFEPIIDRATFTRLQAEMDARATKKAVKSKSMLTGIAVCGICLGPMYRIDAGNRHKDGTRTHLYYYRCHGSDYAPSQCKLMVRLDELEAHVSRCISMDLGERPETETVSVTSDHSDRIAEIEADIRSLDLDDLEYDSKLSGLRQDRQALKSVSAATRTTQTRETGKTWAQAWSELDEAQKRSWLLKMNVKVYVTKPVQQSGIYSASVNLTGERFVAEQQ